MFPLRIGIDFAQFPLVVGGLLQGKFVITRGSKGIKLSSAIGLRKEEVVESLEEARNVLKVYYGAPTFDAAVIVVTNTTTHAQREDIINHGRAVGFNITQVISESAAVAEAFVEKVRPTESTKLVIISSSADILDVSIVSAIPVHVHNLEYDYVLHDHKAHLEDEKHESEGHSGGGMFGVVDGLATRVVHAVVDPVEKVFDALGGLLDNIEIGVENRVHKIILMGKASRSLKVKHLVKERFKDVDIWTQFEEVEEVAAYGAASASVRDKKVELLPGASSGPTPRIYEPSSVSL